MSPPHLITKGTLVPEFPLPTVIFIGFVTAEVATGFVVVQEKFMLQVLAPKATVHEGDAGVRVPDITRAGFTTTVAVAEALGTPVFEQVIT